MNRQDPPPISPHGRAPNTRPRFHHIYYLLAAFDLLTVLLSLFIIDKMTTIYADSVEVNQVWALRQRDFAELSRLAAAVNAPGNDIFNSGNVDAESARFAQAWEQFELRAAAIRRDLNQIVEPERAAVLIQDFNAALLAMDAMVSETRAVFAHFRSDQSQQAGESMARMDREYAHVGATLAELGKRVREIQKTHFDEQAAAAASLRQFEFLIAALIVFMVTGVTFYGHTLAKRMKHAARQTEAGHRALAESEARIRAVLVSTLDPVITFDGHGDVWSASDSVERVFGWSPREMVGRNINLIIPKLEHPARQKPAGVDTGPSDILGRTREFEAVRKDGTALPIELSASRVEAPGRELPLFTGIVRDISERKRAQEELARYQQHLETLVDERTSALEASHERLRLSERLASIGTLAAGLGHDMNNVLFPVRCRLDALDATRLPPEVLEHFVAVRKSLEYLQQLSDGLRLLALDPDESHDTSESTNLQTWWDAVQPLFRSALPRHASLHCDIPPDLPPLAVAAHRLTQAMLNLVVNAGEAIDDPGSVEVSAAALDDRRFVRLCVKDDGHGMSAEVRQHALDPFFTTKKRGMSTGLGLALVHSVCKSANAGIEIDSAPDRGTTVTLTLPVAEMIESPASSAAASSRKAAISISDRRIATLFAALLKSAGCEVNHCDGDTTPDAELWVTSAASTPLAAVTFFVDQTGTHRVILYGDAPPGWAGLDAIAVNESAGLDAIQAAINAALSDEAEAPE